MTGHKLYWHTQTPTSMRHSADQYIEGMGNSSMEIFRNESMEGFVLISFPLGDVYKCAEGHTFPLLP